MSKYKFQLTYTVHPRGKGDEYKQAADKARKLLKDIGGWEPVKKIETTLVGELSLSYENLSDKRQQAKDVVDDIVTSLMKENDIYLNIDVYFSLMVSGLGEHIEFNV